MGTGFLTGPAYSGCGVLNPEFSCGLGAWYRDIELQKQHVFQTLPACPGHRFSPLYKHIWLAAQQIGLGLAPEGDGKYVFLGLVLWMFQQRQRYRGRSQGRIF